MMAVGLHISLLLVCSVVTDKLSCHKCVFHIHDSGPSAGLYMSNMDAKSVIVISNKILSCASLLRLRHF